AHPLRALGIGGPLMAHESLGADRAVHRMGADWHFLGNAVRSKCGGIDLRVPARNVPGVGQPRAHSPRASSWASSRGNTRRALPSKIAWRSSAEMSSASI